MFIHLSSCVMLLLYRPVVLLIISTVIPKDRAFFVWKISWKGNTIIMSIKHQWFFISAVIVSTALGGVYPKEYPDGLATEHKDSVPVVSPMAKGRTYGGLLVVRCPLAWQKKTEVGYAISGVTKLTNCVTFD